MKKTQNIFSEQNSYAKVPIQRNIRALSLIFVILLLILFIIYYLFFVKTIKQENIIITKKTEKKINESTIYNPYFYNNNEKVYGPWGNNIDEISQQKINNDIEFILISDFFLKKTYQKIIQDNKQNNENIKIKVLIGKDTANKVYYKIKLSAINNLSEAKKYVQKFRKLYNVDLRVYKTLSTSR